jgi:hypothetical protein
MWKLVSTPKVWVVTINNILNSTSKWDKASPIQSLDNPTAIMNFYLQTMTKTFASSRPLQPLYLITPTQPVKTTIDQA